MKKNGCKDMNLLKLYLSGFRPGTENEKHETKNIKIK
jgi:hypothetical protein